MIRRTEWELTKQIAQVWLASIFGMVIGNYGFASLLNTEPIRLHWCFSLGIIAPFLMKDFRNYVRFFLFGYSEDKRDIRLL